MNLIAHHSRYAVPSTLHKVACIWRVLPSVILKTFIPHQYIVTKNSSNFSLYSSFKSVSTQSKGMQPQNCLLSQDHQQLTGIPAFYLREKEVNEKIKSKHTVQDQLEFYQSWKDLKSLVNSITALHMIAKIVKKNQRERAILQKERDKEINGTKSAYHEILDFISDQIISCKGQGLSNVIWSLGVIQEKDHHLGKVCEEEILSRDITAFHRAEVCCQILPGCVGLELKHSLVFKRVEEAILAEKIKLHLCENRHICAILSCFTEVGGGSLELFEKLQANIVERDFSSLLVEHLDQILHCFAIKGIFSDQLFSQAEEEILLEGCGNFRMIELVSIPRAFAIAGSGSEQLFAAFEEEICRKRIKYFPLSCLCWITWSFAIRGFTQSMVFKYAAHAIYNRGVKNLKNSGLSLCLYSFVLAESPSRVFVKELGKELLSRDLRIFKGTQLCQLMWACSKAEYLNPELLQRLEEEILQRNLTQKEETILSEILGNTAKEDKNPPPYLRELCISSI